MPCGKQRCMPVQQAFAGERRTEVLRCIEYHLDDTLDVLLGCCQRADLDAETTGD